MTKAETYDVTGQLDIAGTQVTIKGGELTLVKQDGDPGPQPPPRPLTIYLGGIQQPSEIDGSLSNTISVDGKTIRWRGGYAIEVNSVDGFNRLMEKAAEVGRPIYVQLTTGMATDSAIEAVTTNPHNNLIRGGEVEDRPGVSWTETKFNQLVQKASWPIFAFSRMQTVVPSHPNRSHMNYANYAADTRWKTNFRQIPFEPRSDRLAGMQRWIQGGDGRLGAMHVTGFGQTWVKGKWGQEREALAPSMAQLTWMFDQAKRAGCSNVMLWGTRQARGNQLLLTWDRNPQLWYNLVRSVDAFMDDRVIDYLPDGNATLIEVVE